MSFVWFFLIRSPESVRWPIAIRPLPLPYTLAILLLYAQPDQIHYSVCDMLEDGVHNCWEYKYALSLLYNF